MGARRRGSLSLESCGHRTSSHGLVRSQNPDLLVTVAQLLIEAEAGAVDSHDREVRERNRCC